MSGIAPPTPNPLSPPGKLPAPGRRSLWQLLVEPSASLQSVSDRRQARLLSSLLLGLTPLVALGAVIAWMMGRGPLVSLLITATTFGLAAIYGLSRTRHHRLAAALTVIVASITPFALVLVAPSYDSGQTIRSLVWIALTVVLANLLLSLRGLILIILANWLGLILLGLTHPQIDSIIFTFAFIFITGLSIFTVVASRHRDLLERDRLAELSAANRALAAMRASLEKQVEKRAGELAGRTQELEETKNFLDSIIDALPLALFVKDARTLRYVQWNRAAEQLFGSDRSEILGKSDNELSPEEVARQYTGEDRAVIEGTGQLKNVEKITVTKTGERRILNTQKALITGPEGLPKYVLGLSEDVTERRQAEADRASSEAMFRVLFENSPDAIVLIDPYDPTGSWPIIDCNTVACQMNGYRRSELIGHSIDILNTSVGTEAERAAYLGQLQREGTIKLETAHRHKDGRVFPVEVATSLISIGSRLLVLGIDRDITQRKQTEEMLRQQNSYLAATQALSASLDLQTVLGIILAKLKEVVPYDSASVQEIRRGRLEIIGGAGFDNFDKIRGATYDLTSDTNPNRRVILSRQPIILDDIQNLTYPDFQRQLHNLAGINSWLGVPLLFGDSAIGMITLDKKDPNFYTATHADIAMSFAAQAAIAINNARTYTTAQEYAAENEALYNAATQLINPGADINSLAQQIARAVTHEFALSNCGVLLLNDSGTALQRVATSGNFQVTNVATLPLSGQGLTVSAVRSGEMVYAADVLADPRYLAGGSQTLSELVMPLKNQNRVIGVLDLQSPDQDAFDERAQRIIAAFAKQAALALENASLLANLQQAYRRLQEDQEHLLAAEKMASLGRLTAGIAHEMNTPLAAMRSSLAELGTLIEEYQAAIGDPDITPDDHQAIGHDMKKAVQLAKSAGEKAAAFVRSIKSKTRDPSPQEKVYFQLVPVIKDTLLLLGHALRQGNCTAPFEYETEAASLTGSPGRISQVVTNLVANAIDASAVKGGGPIQVRLAQTAAGIDLIVSDSGVGIPPELLTKIFEPMFTTKPFGQGTGLGLTLIYDIVTGDFGGTVEVVSQPDHGATFTVHIPLPQEA